MIGNVYNGVGGYLYNGVGGYLNNIFLTRFSAAALLTPRRKHFRCGFVFPAHYQAKVNKFKSQSKHFIGHGSQKEHSNTISTIIKAQLFPLIYDSGKI